MFHVAILNEVAGNVVLTSTVKENGRQFACDAELVTFTCQVVGSVSLLWESPLFSPNVIFSIGDTPPESVSRPPFIATLTSVAGNGTNTNYTSTLQVTASRTYTGNNTTVVCLNQLRVSEESNFTVAGTCNTCESVYSRHYM